MFGTVLTTLFTLILIYLLWRAASVPFVARTVPRWCLIAFGAFLWILFSLGRHFGHGGEGTPAAVLEYLGMNSLGIVFLAFVVMVAVDLVTAFGLLLPRRAPSIRGWALVVSALLAALALVQGHRAPAVVPYEIRLKGLPPELDGAVLVALSDTHLGQLLGERWLRARVRQVGALSPDIIALVGDIFEGHGGPPDGTLATLRGLSAPLGVWFVSGNHEGHGGRQANGEVLSRAGFKGVDDLWTEVRPGLVLALRLPRAQEVSPAGRPV